MTDRAILEIPNSVPYLPHEQRPCAYCGKRTALRDGKLVNRLADGSIGEHRCVRAS